MKKIVLFTLILNAFLWVNAQVVQGNAFVPRYYPSSPNVSALGSFGMFPMNLSTGQPNIGIPLFSNNNYGNDADISLNYNISSVKPDFQTSWVGLGWNLSVGGAITRLVNGGIDECYLNGFTDPTVFSYYDHYTRLNTPDWFSDAKMTQYYQFMTPLFPTHNEAFPSPDEFAFNVNGLNGSFFKNHEGKWVVKANQNLDIDVKEELKYDFTFRENGGPTNQVDWFLKRIIYGFVLTDQNGTKYTFGKDPNALEINGIETVDTAYNPAMYVKSWYLTKIEYANGKNMTFEYAFDNRATYVVHSSAYYSTYKTQSSSVSQSNTSGNFNLLTLDRSFYKYLSKIKFDNNEISFYKSYSNALDYDTQSVPWGQLNTNYEMIHYPGNYNNRKHWYKLDSIVVKANNVRTNAVAFNYENTANYRLRLLNVSIGKSQQTKQQYSFEYNPLRLPEFNVNKTDHWGNYNNKNFETTVPQTNYTYSKAQMLTYPQYREPDFTYGTAELLQKIIYPTKGYTLIEYEPHNYSKLLNKTISGFDVNATGNKIAGGARVKKMFTNDLVNTYSKSFFYVDDYLNGSTTSSGVLGGMPNYFDEANINNGNLEFWKLSSSSYIPLNYTNGNYVTYSKVYERSENGAVTEHTFSNQDNGFKDLKSNNYQLIQGNIGYVNTFEPANISIVKNALDKLAYNNLEVERGKPLSERYYDSNKNLLKEIVYNYNTNPSRLTDKIRSISYIADVYGKPVNMAMYDMIAQMHVVSKMSAHTIYSHHTPLISTTNIEYFNNNPVTSSTQYIYGTTNHHQLLTQKNISPDGINNQTDYSYAHEKGNQLMISKNMVGIPLETITSQTTNGATKTLSRVETMYPSSVPTSQSGDLVLPLSVKTYDILNNIPSTEVTYDYYDNKGNVIQYTTKDGATVGIVWGYNKSLPIAKIEGKDAAYFMTMLADENNTLSIASNSDIDIITEENFRTKLDLFQSRQNFFNVLITTYTHDPLIGVTSITPPSKIRTFYKYDSAGRLEKVVDANGQVLKEMKYNYKN
ncbi:RHS repeat protein [Chryseobacterium indologenes]|uniref:RHS repeat protein n=1 Tax=Chryseobacterium indologenes TaxID=253 RepID=UPI0016281AF0|nr:RHS repeat protein [Chryseobacterium indologenes]